MPEAPTAEFDAYAGDYDAAINRGLKFTGETKEYFAETRIEWLKARLKEVGLTPKSCLDFGCGTGTSAPLLVSGLGLDTYIGYDPSSESITEASKEHPDPACTFIHDVDKLPKHTLDLAFCNGVFHHIPIAARQEAFQHVYDSLRPGGWFAFWENNKWNPIVHLLMSRVPFDRDAIMLFPGEAARHMERAGFKIGLRDYLFVFPASLKALRPLEPALCKLPLGGQYLILAHKV
ncbi:Methyltransferase domain-containing protein [Prosthecobacter debontii]|uniref:Methyltransferase domain-containing protein n=1 Tax=Prosthecobacter debontii TaxID=48467 RepID=A0A1T4X5D7_9BACT|nr:class I SAM-dependent methyltransferase [Prosthecobacter debontii]SKA84338.1 Methyltransferase domain-containing protein [Prosthecobacter debontii]